MYCFVWVREIIDYYISVVDGFYFVYVIMFNDRVK